MRASVIVPVYNVEKYINRCIDSLLSQSIDDYEIICVNDCSPDNSATILADYEEKGLIRVISNTENLGQGRSRMKAVHEAKGDVILFVDSDDYVANDYIETFLCELEKAEYDVIIAGYTKDYDGKMVPVSVDDGPLTLVCYVLACCKAFRKKFLIDNHISFSEKRAGEDIYFNVSLFCSDAKVKVIDYNGYFYYFNQSSTTNSIRPDRAFEKVVAEMFELLDEKYDFSSMPKEKYYVVQYSYLANMINALITYGHGSGPKKMRTKYDYFISNLQKKFPDYKDNPYLKGKNLVGPTTRTKKGVSVVTRMMKCHLGWPLFWIISLL